MESERGEIHKINTSLTQVNQPKMSRGFAMFLVFLTVLVIIVSFEDEAEALTIVIYRRRRTSNKKKQQRGNLKKASHLLRKALKVEKKALKVNFEGFFQFLILLVQVEILVIYYISPLPYVCCSLDLYKELNV